MFKLILLIILGYFVYKIFRSFLMPNTEKEKVKGNKAQSNKKSNLDNKKIEDVDFEEIE